MWGVFLNIFKYSFDFSYKYFLSLIKWILLGTIVGAFSGVIGSVFHLSIDYATELREQNPLYLLLLPFAGLFIVGIYHIFKKKGNIDTNRVIESVEGSKNVPLIMAPLIFISTVLTHLCGGSAGREGAALQLGGSIGYNLGKLFKLNKNNLHIIVMCGMSGVFAALFGTPLTATVFALEVATVGIIHYIGFLPCIISSIIAYIISLKFGISPVHFENIAIIDLSAQSIIKITVLSLLCALVSILFCMTIKGFEKASKKIFPNSYIKAAVGGIIIIILTFLLKTHEYNGAGMDTVRAAINGIAKPEAFILKIIFTAITISAGFRGGEIVPAFFIGSTFGCVIGPLLGINAGFSAAIGFVSLFCGVVNCPLASLILSVEVFGSEGLLFFAIACAVSYMMSGCFGLYHSQRIVYSKINDELININTK